MSFSVNKSDILLTICRLFRFLFPLVQNSCGKQMCYVGSSLLRVELCPLKRYVEVPTLSTSERDPTQQVGGCRFTWSKLKCNHTGVRWVINIRWRKEIHRGDGHVKMGQIGVRLPHTKEYPGLPESGRGKKESSSRGFRGSKFLQTPWFQNLKAVREHISVVLKYPICCTLLWRPKETLLKIATDIKPEWIILNFTFSSLYQDGKKSFESFHSQCSWVAQLMVTGSWD